MSFGTVCKNALFDAGTHFIPFQPIYSTNIFGDGSDGATTIAACTKITRPMYYSNLTVNSGKKITGGGIVSIFSQNCVTLCGGICASGANGGTKISGGQGGHSAWACCDGAPITLTYTGYHSNGNTYSGPIAAVMGGGGGGGLVQAGTIGSPPSNANYNSGILLSNVIQSGGTGGTGGQAVNQRPCGGCKQFTPGLGGGSPGKGGGSGGLANTTHCGAYPYVGGAGGGGGAAGYITIYAKNIKVNASGFIKAVGGTGGTGCAGQHTIICGRCNFTGGDGGGGGGGGGYIYIASASYNNSGTVSANGGCGGAGQAGSGSCSTAGGNGINGTNGPVKRVVIS